ncbi:MAG: YdeI/OmpD-associated family protein [Cyclobacteriaceae bacterium]|nr:YdeI/OmpD-associated family protein [Cyclobacteriaceae bacterium]
MKVKFKTDQELRSCFDDLSLSRQREFTEYISEAKREETKLKRLEKIIPMIKEKIGLSDKYR